MKGAWQIGVVLCVLQLAPAQAEPRHTALAQAKAHFKQGDTFLAAGDYEHAIAEYHAAYDLAPLPDVLLKLGQAHRLRGEDDQAVDYYRKAEAAAPAGAVRDEAQRRIAELTADKTRRKEERTRAAESVAAERAAAERSAAEQSAAEQSAAERRAAVKAAAERVSLDLAHDELRSARVQKTAGVVVLVVGVASLALGGAFVGLADQADHDLLHPKDGVFSSSAEQHRRSYQIAEVSLFSFGGVAAVTGLALFLVGRHETKRWSVSASASAGSVHASYELRF